MKTSLERLFQLEGEAYPKALWQGGRKKFDVFDGHGKPAQSEVARKEMLGKSLKRSKM